MENEKNSLVKVESDIVAKGDQLLALTNKTLAHYHSELREWWNSLDDSWKHEFIYKFIDQEGIPRELLEQGKIFNRKRHIQDTIEWEIIADEKGNIQREPLDCELERIILTRDLNTSAGHEDLQPLFKLKPLTHLSVSDIWNLRSLSGIEDLINLKEIDIRWSLISDLEPLRKLSKLEKLNLYYSDLKSLDPLCGLHELTDLNIGAAFGLNDLTPLSSLSNLFELNCSALCDSNNRIDFTPINNLHNLVKLNCEDNHLESLDFLKDLRKLEWLNLAQTDIDNPDLTPLINLKNLNRLRLSSTAVKEIAPLHYLPSLEYLWIDKTNILESQIISLSKANPNCTIVVDDSSFIDGTSIFYEGGSKKHEKLRQK